MTYSPTLRWTLLTVLLFITLLYLLPGTARSADTKELLNVSYDPTRELYEEINPLFAKYWKEKTGEIIDIKQSHGGSGKQARAVIDGLPADIVSLALAYDIDIISQKTQRIPSDWQSRLASNSSPYTSTIVFLVRKDNPKNIKDWDDLIKPGIQVITPNPKTSGGARWNYLAAWAYANKKFNPDEAKVKDFVAKLFNNVPILDTGARGSTITFVQRGIGDVLISWENEAFLAMNELGKDQFEMITPSISILAEPPVTVVDKNAKKKDNYEVAKAYLEFLYTQPAQEVIAKNYYRPIDKEVAAKFADSFPAIDLVTINSFGGWKKAQEAHFNDGGIYDQIYKR